MQQQQSQAHNTRLTVTHLQQCQPLLATFLNNGLLVLLIVIIISIHVNWPSTHNTRLTELCSTSGTFVMRKQMLIQLHMSQHL